MKFQDNPLVAGIGGGIIIIAAVIIQYLLARRVTDEQNKPRVRIFVWIVAAYALVLLETSIYRDRLGQMAIAAGLIGAGAAVAFQEVVASVAGWLTILLAGFYRVGDRVEVGGIQGDVIEIGVLRTRLMEIGSWIKGDLHNGRIVFVANSFIFKAPVYNYSKSFEFLWDELTLPIRYDSDIEFARQTFHDIAEEVTRPYIEAAAKNWEQMKENYAVQEDVHVEPLVTLAATDNWVQFTLRYVVSYPKRRFAKDEIFTQVLHAINASEGKIALASSTSQIVQPSSIDVVLKRPKRVPHIETTEASERANGSARAGEEQRKAA